MSRLTLVMAVCALATAGCSSTDPVTPTPTPTTPVVVTDSFSGALNRNGAATYSFTTASSGEVQATLTALSPDTALIIGLGVGTWNGSACQVVLANDRATLGSSVRGAASGAGSYCVRVYDVGNVTDPATYELVVRHP